MNMQRVYKERMREIEEYKNLFGDDYWANKLWSWIKGEPVMVKHDIKEEIAAIYFLKKLDGFYRNRKLSPFEYEVIEETFNEMYLLSRDQLKGE